MKKNVKTRSQVIKLRKDAIRGLDGTPPPATVCEVSTAIPSDCNVACKDLPP